MRAVVIAAIAVFVALLACLLCGILYVRFGWFKPVYHDILGWHEPDETKSAKWFDGASWHCMCKYCRKPIMQDSQGNWF